MQLIRELLFPSRIGRLSFYLRRFLIEMPVYIYQVERGVFAKPRFAPAIAIGVVLLLYLVVFVLLPRVRDCGLKWWTMPALAIPFLSSFYLILIHFKSGFTELNARLRAAYAAHKRDWIPPVVPVRTTIAGSSCGKCGAKILFESDGVADPYGKVICRKCDAPAEEQNR